MDDFSRCRVSLEQLGASTQVFLIPVWPAQDSRERPPDWLDAQEQQTASGFVHERDRRLYELSHLWLRYLLAQATGCVPQALRIVRAEHGKPRLEGAGLSVFFSLSHTHSCIAIALRACGEVGVDIEGVDSVLDVVGLQDLVLHPAERHGNPGTTRFFRLWTLKEAYAKALGLGLGVPFDRLAMTINPDGTVSIRDESGLGVMSSGMRLHSRMLSIASVGARQEYTLGLAEPLCAAPPEFHIVDNRPDPAAIALYA